jgi:hypothetical protein
MKKILETISGAVVTSAALAGCSGFGFEDALLAEVDSSAGEGVVLSEVIEGDWDHFLVVCPYDPDVSDRLGFEWSDEPDTARQDATQMIVLTKGESVYSTRTLSFRNVSFCENGIRQLESAEDPLDFVKNDSGIWEANNKQ